MRSRGGLWTLSARSWLAIFAVAISVLGGWVGISAVQTADHPLTGGPVAGGVPTPGSGGGTPAFESPGTVPAEPVAALSIVQPPLLGKSAVEVLALLPVRDADTSADYQRTVQFGEAWLDVDANGCSTREDILLRDLSDTVLNGCKVMSGRVVDPYSGRLIEFIRGNDTSMLVQIDHIVALYNAWTTGAQQLSFDERVRLANDPTNLFAVSEETNQSKGAGDAASWMPPNPAVHCEYAARQISVKYAYDLWVTAAERNALADVLRVCPGQPAYRSSLGSNTPVLGFASNPQPTATATPAPTTPATEPGTSGGSVYYENCSAAYAAGVSNIPQGAPGYRPELDQDRDGIACEG